MENMGMKVLVTGNLGYIGAVLVPMLIREGHEVIGLDNNMFQACFYGQKMLAVETIHKDIRDVEVSDLLGFDAVIHLAGLSNDPLGELNPDITFEINYLATVELARNARQAGVKRFIFSSSCSTYGASGDEILDEKAAFNPVTSYGKSKVLAEQGLAELADDSFCVTSLRNATAYGYSPMIRFDLVVNNLSAWAYTTGKVLIKSDGTPWRPLVHTEDISRAFIEVLKSPAEQVSGEAFNVGRKGDNYRISDLAAIVRGAVPGSEISFASDPPVDTRNYRVNFNKIHQALPGFQPAWDVRKGVEQLVGSYREYSLSDGEFEGETYRRITRVRRLMHEGKLDASLRWTGGD